MAMAQSSGPAWQCKKCTLLNQPMHLLCAACSEKRPPSPRLGPGGRGGGGRGSGGGAAAPAAPPPPPARSPPGVGGGPRPSPSVERPDPQRRSSGSGASSQPPEFLRVTGPEHLTGVYRLAPDASEWLHPSGSIAIRPFTGASPPFWQFANVRPNGERTPTGVRSRDQAESPIKVHPWIDSSSCIVQGLVVMKGASPPLPQPPLPPPSEGTGDHTGGFASILSSFDGPGRDDPPVIPPPGRPAHHDPDMMVLSGRFRIAPGAKEALEHFLRNPRDRSVPQGAPGAVLGQGCYGVVVRGKDSDDGKDVAIKFVDLSRCASDKMTPREGAEAKRKMRERELLLPRDMPTHSNIVSMIDREESGDLIIMIYELMAGGDLQQYIRRGLESPAAGGAHPVFEQLVGDLIKGTRELHRKNIAHRDLKPQNLLLSSRDLRVAVMKIADFGFARKQGPEDLMRTAVGTPLYVAPEVVLGRAPYTVKADVYSIGVVIVQMATGQYPVNAVEAQALYQKKHRAELTSQVMNGIKQPGCKDFCCMLLSPSGEQRPDLADPAVEDNPFVQVCFKARRERPTAGGKLPPRQPPPPPPQVWQRPREVLGPCVSVAIAPRGLGCDDALCFAVDSRRRRTLIGTSQGFDIVEDCKRIASAPLGDAAAMPSSADRYRRLNGGVQAVVVLGVSLSAGGDPKMSFAIAGGGRPAALLPGEVGLWDDDAAELVAVDTCRWTVRPDSPHPVVSLAADGHWLAAATAEAVYIWALDGVPARPQRMHRLPTAPNPTGVLYISQRDASEGPESRAMVCYPYNADKKGVVGIAVLTHASQPPRPPLRQACRQVRHRAQQQCPQAADGNSSVPEQHVYSLDSGRGEELSALVCHMKSGNIAATTQTGYGVYMWNLDTGAEVTVLSRGTTQSAISSLSIVDRPGIASAVLAVSAQGSAHVWTRLRKGSWREGHHLTQKHQVADRVVAAAFVEPSTDLPVGWECFWVLGPETKTLQKYHVGISGSGDSMRLVQKLSLPPAPWVGIEDAVPSLADRPRHDTILAINLDGADPSQPHMTINPTGRLDDAPVPCGILLRGSEILLLGSHPYVMPHMWLKVAVLLTRGGARPGVVQLEYRVGQICATIELEFPRESTAASLFDRVVASTECAPQDKSGRAAGTPVPVPQQLLAPSPCRPLWLFLLWQQRLDRIGSAHTRWLPDVERRRAPSGLLGPRSLRHLVHAFIAGPRPVPPPGVQAPTGAGWLSSWLGGGSR
eukprot:TRINITY_DN5670_c0_g5_i1.p1 TRINITY_DN5670_c0_g5~~TRINITY_DN5670_c0_g5_i1.p1  ORF type:complete len:1244 (+),score=309.84 TRINITY_DN5670_c0_g5_i1:130-3861(+)